MLLALEAGQGQGWEPLERMNSLLSKKSGAALGVFFGAGLLWLGLLCAPCIATAQAQAQVQSAAISAASPAPAARVAASAAKSNGTNARAITKPLWGDLKPAQQQALAPLSAKWNTVSEAQKRKWLALSENFPKMSGAEQAKLHSRMTEWATLSPQQRTQARLNFAETQQLSPDDKKAKWEAYQALPPEEKHKLAAGAAKPPQTAVAVKPVAPDKLAIVPKSHRGRKQRRPVSPRRLTRWTTTPCCPSRRWTPTPCCPIRCRRPRLHRKIEICTPMADELPGVASPDIYIYGYLNRLASRRRLERECQTNGEEA